MKYPIPLFVLFVLLAGCARPSALEQLEADVRAEFDRSAGTYALAFLDLQDSTRRLLINDTVTFHAASTMKTPVLIEVYKQAARGRFRLEDSLVVKNEFTSIVDSSAFSLDVGDDSEEKLYGMIGQKAGIYDLVYDMIIYSSNLATNIVIELVDARRVTQTMRELGAPYIQVRRGVEDIKAYERGLNNTTTAYDLMTIFEAIGRGEAVSPGASEAMIKILLDQKFNEVIPAQLPPDVKVAHKTGWISTARHDSGIVFLPDGRKYVLVLLSKNWEADDTAIEVMANASRMVYEYMVSR